MTALRCSCVTPRGIFGMPSEKKPPAGYVPVEYIEVQSSSIGTYFKTPVEFHTVPAREGDHLIDVTWSLGNSAYLSSDCHFGGVGLFAFFFGIYRSAFRFGINDVAYPQAYYDGVQKVALSRVGRFVMVGRDSSFYADDVLQTSDEWPVFSESVKWTRSDYVSPGGFCTDGFKHDMIVFGAETRGINVVNGVWSFQGSYPFTSYIRPGSRFHRYCLWNGAFKDGFCAVPVKNVSTGEGLLYDAFSGNMCVKVGNGTYLCGPEKGGKMWYEQNVW